MLAEGVAALQKSGMPAEHARCFQWVADRTKCVISSRSVGRYATGLLLENYATKGFHNKAKSCDWGPMAGFVLADPTFTKRGTDAQAMSTQAADLRKAIHEGGSEIPIFITERRRQELENSLGCLSAPEKPASNINTKHYTCKGKKFVLTRAMDAPGAQGQQLWAVCYAPGAEIYGPNMMRSVSAGITPVRAMVDPACPRDVARTYRGATTGDYDLFAIFPPAKGAEKFSQAQDARPVAGSDRFKVPMSAYKAEDPHMGNITARGKTIKDMLNDRIKVDAKYTGGNCVHHSDEAGRPCVSDVDYPFIAFIPGKLNPYLIQNNGEFKEFLGVRYCGLKYYATFNPGWHASLGILTSQGGSYTV